MAGASTQQFLELEEIRDNVVLLRSKAIRGVLMVSSQNFALKSEEEQEATIYQFQAFLNSLDFTVQIVAQSRRLNITGYLDWLKTLEGQQTNDLLKELTADYRKFVSQMIGGGSIMAKNFFVVVPFTLAETQGETGGVFNVLKSSAKQTLSGEQFERMKHQLWQRMEYVAVGLRRSGLQSTPLNTEELVELFWSWHHPAEAEVGYYPEIPPELLK